MKLCCFFILLSLVSVGQNVLLKPGFSKPEYIELLKISSRQGDTLYNSKFPAPENHTHIYRSPVVGLDNRWDLWLSKDSILVISLRGTTGKEESFLENFYAAMVPAKGKIVLEKNFQFDYKLADHPEAAVHLGWLIGMAYLSRDILPKIDSCSKNGYKNFLIMGHSQGGAIAYLLNMHLKFLQKTAALDPDIQFKIYCSAAPKPGNLYFAYEYEALNENKWSYTVLNAADWVPETPFSVQTTLDFNKTNPFQNSKEFLGSSTFPKNLILKYVYSQLKHPPKKANKRFQYYLGKKMTGYIQKYLPEFIEPKFYNSSAYVRIGPTVVLLPNQEYHSKFIDKEGKLWTHHLFEPYLFLAEKLE